MANIQGDIFSFQDNFKKMLQLQDRLGDPDFIQPNRVLIKEGNINKISRNAVNQRYLVLCNDYLIYAKKTSSSDVSANLKISYKIPLSKLKVSLPSSPEEYPCDFNMVSPVRSCTLRAQSEVERGQWVSAFQNAIEAHLKRRETFSKAATAATAAKSDSDTERLGEKAPIWVPDERVTMCVSFFLKKKSALINDFYELMSLHDTSRFSKVATSTSPSSSGATTAGRAETLFAARARATRPRSSTATTSLRGSAPLASRNYKTVGRLLSS
jgi:hypothetical protein